MIHITLSNEEALVLFDLLSRGACAQLTFADPAEQRVLWDVEAMLESQLVEPMRPEYAELLVAARERVRHKLDRP